MAYKPTIIDIMWADSVLRMIDNEGIVIYPSSQLVYRVSHRSRVLTLLNPQHLGTDSVAKDLHERTKAVFAFFEYTVESVGGGG
jgi:hypothetical protein